MSDLCEDLRAIAQGNEVAFTRLYRSESRALLVFARGLLAGDHSAAEDAVDFAFVAVWQSAGRFKGQINGHAKAWLRRIVRNKAVDWLRSNGRYELGYETDTAASDHDMVKATINPL